MSAGALTQRFSDRLAIFHRGGVVAAGMRDGKARLRSPKRPRYGECFRALGIAYARVGDKSWAVRYYRKYLQVMPEAPDAEKVKEILAAFESKN